MIRATDIHSLTDFTRNAKTYIKKIKDSKCPIALTVNGDAEVVVQDAAAYQEMVDELEHSRFVAAMREGIQDVEAGRTRPAHVVFAELKAKYEI